MTARRQPPRSRACRAPGLLAGLALLGLGLLGAPRPALGAEFPTVYYRDAVHKFSFKVFKDWAQVPLQADERIQVAKFAESRGGGGYFPTQLVVVRIDRREGGEEPPVTGDVPEQIRRWRAAQNPRTAWDATVGRLRFPEGAEPDPEDYEEIRSKDRVDGRLWAFEIAYGRGRDATLFNVLVAFEKEGIEYGILMQCPLTRRRKYEKGFEKLGKTFRFFDEKAEDVETLDELDGVAISPARRRAIERSMVEDWDIVVSPKKQYIVLYNVNRQKNHALAREIARRIEMIREQIYEVQFPPAQPITAVSIVRVCKDRREYFAYGGPGGSAGYWNSAAEELVFYDASPARKIDDDTVAVLYHEAFHQYIYYSVGNVAPHSWFNEGHGDYYAGAELKGRRFVIGVFRWRQGIIKNAVAKGPRERVEVEGPDGNPVMRYANDGGYTPLADLVTFSQMDYYSYAGISYAQGWSLIYFLREIVPKNRKYREKWGHILDTYFETLKREVNATGELRPGGRPDDEEGNEGDGEEPLPPAPDPGEEEGDEEGPTTPGEEEEDEEEEGEGEEEDLYRPAPMPFGGLGGPRALQKAVEEAFRGIDFAELEEAWAEAVRKDM